MKQRGRWLGALFGFVLCAAVIVPGMSASAAEPTREVVEHRGYVGPYGVELPDDEAVVEAVPERSTAAWRANDSYWKNLGSDYYRTAAIDPEVKQLWDALENRCIQLLNNTETTKNTLVYMDMSDFIETDVIEFVTAFKLSNPQYYFLSNEVVYDPENLNQWGLNIYPEFQNGYSRQTATANFKQKLDSWISQVKKGTYDEDKECIAFEIIAQNVDYDDVTPELPINQSAYSAVCTGKSVCTGYAETMSILMNACGLESIIVTSNNHAWNVIKIHGEWYMVDPTVGDQDWGVTYRRYNKSYRTMVSEDYDYRLENRIWNDWAPDALCDSTMSGNDHVYPYFNLNGFTYFKINDNPNLGNRIARAVAASNSAAKVPQFINYNGIQYLVGWIFEDNGTYYYCYNGELNGNYTGIVYYDNNYWYVNRGKVEFITGLRNVDGTWYYISNGLYKSNVTGLCQYGSDWYYVKNGAVDFGYTGLCQYSGNWWYVQNGKVNLKATGLCQYGGNWWYVEKGMVNLKATGLVQYNGDWWYVKGGAVDFKATGLVQYGGNWWYVQNGKVNFKAAGLYQYGGNWWYVAGGKVDFKATGLCQYGGNWWYVEKGMVNLKATGLVPYGGNWWYVQNGAVNFNYNGQANYGGKTYNVRGGKVVF